MERKIPHLLENVFFHAVSKALLVTNQIVIFSIFSKERIDGWRDTYDEKQLYNKSNRLNFKNYQVSLSNDTTSLLLKDFDNGRK